MQEVSRQTIISATNKMIDGTMVRLKSEKVAEYKKMADRLFSNWMYIFSVNNDGTASFCTKKHFIFDGFSLNDFEI